MTSNNTASLNEIRRVFYLTVSKTTVWRTLKENPFIRKTSYSNKASLSSTLTVTLIRPESYEESLGNISPSSLCS
uniref:Transposable element Tc3 transposase-like DNA-binding HTH domain-containing protein n=1 Tax=Heterorhabditis bacteriophora TaxID=37862 RepID=A0A1I7WQK5_HETBA